MRRPSPSRLQMRQIHAVRGQTGTAAGAEHAASEGGTYLRSPSALQKVARYPATPCGAIVDPSRLSLVWIVFWGRTEARPLHLCGHPWPLCAAACRRRAALLCAPKQRAAVRLFPAAAQGVTEVRDAPGPISLPRSGLAPRSSSVSMTAVCSRSTANANGELAAPRSCPSDHPRSGSAPPSSRATTVAVCPRAAATASGDSVASKPNGPAASPSLGLAPRLLRVSSSSRTTAVCPSCAACNQRTNRRM